MNPVNAVLHAVSAATGLPVKAITGPDRTAGIAMARFAIVRLLRELAPWLSYAELAAAIGRRDHGTAMHAARRAANLRAKSEIFRGILARAASYLAEHTFPAV